MRRRNAHLWHRQRTAVGVLHQRHLHAPVLFVPFNGVLHKPKTAAMRQSGLNARHSAAASATPHRGNKTNPQRRQRGTLRRV